MGHIIAFPRNTIALPCNNIAFSRNIISFNNIWRERNNFVTFQFILDCHCKHR